MKHWPCDSPFLVELKMVQDVGFLAGQGPLVQCSVVTAGD